MGYKLLLGVWAPIGRHGWPLLRSGSAAGATLQLAAPAAGAAPCRIVVSIQMPQHGAPAPPPAVTSGRR